MKCTNCSKEKDGTTIVDKKRANSSSYVMNAYSLNCSSKREVGYSFLQQLPMNDYCIGGITTATYESLLSRKILKIPLNVLARKLGIPKISADWLKDTIEKETKIDRIEKI